ncbi:MAG: NHLP leader peptide family natural product precursor [bacterium]|jgi:hypothetical protein
MSTSSTSAENDQARLLAKAWSDSDFKTRLVNDPVTVCNEENVDITKYLSPGYKKGDPIPVTLPPAPADAGTMSRDQLQAAASTALSQMGEMF